MDRSTEQRRWFWATLALSSLSIVAVVFAVWEVVENRFFRDFDYLMLHYLYITRGILSSLLLAFWAAWFVVRQRRRSEEELRRSREHYRGLLDASPGAVALYDQALQVSEWNRTAERLYGFRREEVLGKDLPTLPPEKAGELRDLLRQVEAGTPVMEIETVRRGRDGALFDVQLNLLPYCEAGGQKYFLEVSTDIRERVRLRRRLLEIEKLTSMGKMAAGTAHHLNTPLAALLLRVQMIRERQNCAPADLERIETGLRFCQHFVQRLLEFSRRPPVEKQPEDIRAVVQSVASFLAPAMLARRARLALELGAASGVHVFADRNLLEALFTTLLSNALDAIPPDGSIEVRATRPAPDCVEIEVADNGSGVAPEDLPYVFEPFFTTKKPGEGTGLGLAIAHNIVLEHGGSVRLENGPCGGATVFVRFPLCPARVGQEVSA